MNSPFQPKKLNVPGLMGDDALNESLKQFSSAGNAAQSAAPPPSSAVDMVDRIQKEYLDKPTPSIRGVTAALPGPLGLLAGGVGTIAAGAQGPAVPAAPAPIDPQQRAVDIRSGILSNASDSVLNTMRDMGGLPEAAAGGIRTLTQLGTLQTPEQQTAAAQDIADEMKANEAATRAHADARAKLRGLSDADAEAMGFPVAPGGTDTAAQAQSAQGDVKQIAEAQQKNLDAIAALKDPAKQPKQTWWLDAMQSGLKGAAQMGTGGASGVLEWGEMLRDASGVGYLTGGGRSNLRAWVDTVDATLNKLLPGDKARSQTFVHQLAQGAGSMAGFLIAGYGAAALGAPESAAVAGLGAATQGDQQFKDAEQFNATTVQKYLALIAGSALGLTEAIPIDRMFMRAEAATGGLVSRMLRSSLAGSMQEFTQEFGQAVGQDVVARLLYDENRKMDVASWLKQGAVGAITGGLADAAVHAFHETGVSSHVSEPPVAPEQKQAIAQQVIDNLQNVLDSITASHQDAVARAQPLSNIVQPEPAAQRVVQGPGGTIPVNENGQFEAHHESGQQLATIDPAQRGTGPLRGGERARLFGPDAVDRSYFGVGDPNFVRPKGQPYKLDTDPYHGEGLGPFRHTVEVDPAKVYNWFEDPLNLKSQLDRTAPASEQVTRYEKLIKDAGFQGVYFSESPIGQTAMMFEATSPRRIIDKRTGLVQNFQVPDVTKIDVPQEDLQPLPGLSTGRPVKSVVQAARAYAAARGLPVRRQGEYVQADPARGKRIAQAYADMKHQPSNPKVKAAYQAMIDETLAQYQFVKATGLKIEAIEPGMPDPYPGGPKEVLADLQKGHLWFFPTESGFGSSEADVKDNPLLAPTKEKLNGRTLLANDVFRIVHDFFGHGIEGSGFGARGEENAWQSHMRLYSAAALPAVTSETRGQNSWVNFGPHGEANRSNQRETVYADQKTGIMPSWTWKEGVADDGSEADLLARIETPERVQQLTQQVPGLKGVMKYMTPDEQAKLKKQNAAAIVQLFTELPDAEEMAAVAFSGRAKRGWYERSAKALVDIFGLNDAPRFAALLAALSPQTSVKSNAVNALQMWTSWSKAGRPTNEAAIRTLLGQSVQGGKGEGSVLPAWIPNTITALTEPDSLNIQLSGPKVDSFMKNLQGRVNEVTNDAWMANFANVDQTLFRKTGPSPGKGAGYIAMNAVVRKAAEVATQMTGEQWTPSEIQETVWSWAKTLHDKAYGSGFAMAGKAGEIESMIKAGKLTAEEISDTPDFASLFVSGAYRSILEAGGYDLESVAAGGSGADGSTGGRGSPLSAEGSGLAQDTFDRHLRRAARRLDELRARRAAEAAQQGADQSVTTDETFFPDTGQRQTALDQLTPEDRAFLDEQMLANTPKPQTTANADLARPKGGVPGEATDTGENADVNLIKIANSVSTLLDMTVRQGRLTVKGGAVGQYDRKQDVARVMKMDDVSTRVHEGGHDLYFNAGNDLKQFIAGNDVELMKVAADLYGGDTNVMPKSTHIAEGFAEFFRVYTLNRAYADRHYPTLTSAFDAVLEKDAPHLKSGLAAIGQQYAAWMQLPSTQVLRNMIVSGKQNTGVNAAIKEIADAGFGTWMHEYARQSVAASVNQFAALNDLVSQALNTAQDNTGKALDLKRSEDPRVLQRLAANSGAAAQIQITDGVNGYHSTKPFTRSLREALLRYHGKGASENLSRIDPVRQKDFASYLVALRGIDEFRRLAEGKIKNMPLGPKVSLDELTTTVKELEGKYGVDFVEAAKIVHEYAMGLWQKSYDAGLMDEETYTDGQDRQFYAPLQRDMSDKKSSLGSSALTGAGRFVKQFRGSGRNIIDPMDVLMHKTFALEQVIARNEVFLTLGKLADRAGKVGALVERVPAKQLMGQQLSVADVAKQLTKDPDITAADAQDLMEILQASMENDNAINLFRSEPVRTKGENIVFGWQGGKLAALQLADDELGADVVNTLNALGKENMPLFTGLLSASSTLFRGGIVSWPDFLVANFIKDQFSAFILTDVGFKPFATGVKGMFDELRQSNIARQYNAAMGTMGGMNVANLHEARINRDIASIRKQGYVAKSFAGHGLKGALQGMARIIELSETGTRLGVYGAAYSRAKKDGLTDWDASIEAAYTATDLMDFGLHGSRVLLLRRTIPFLNAQLQGLYKMMRTLGADEVRQRKGMRFVLASYFKSTKNLDLSRNEKQAINTGRKAWVKMASLGLISAALHFLFRDDPDYQNASEYLRTTGWVIPLGDGRLFYIPKPYELAILANFTERALESADGDTEALSRFQRGLAMTFLPPVSPPLIKVAVEAALNRDSFTGGEIVPSYMQGLAPELQFNNYTSTLAKQLGHITGMSPLMIDHVMSGLGATAYRDLSSMYNATDRNRGTTDPTDMPFVRRFYRDATRGSTTQQDFWRVASTMNGVLRSAEASYKNLLNSGNTQAADQFLDTLGPDERAYAILATDFKADAKRLNPYYRARQIATITSALRREMVTEIGVQDTTTKVSGTFKLTAKEKTSLDDALAEYTQREMRNTLVAMDAPGWTGKKMLDTERSLNLINRIEPRVGAELQRRIEKAKIYDFKTIVQYWPEVKNRLLRDRENSFLGDIVSIAQVMR